MWDDNRDHELPHLGCNNLEVNWPGTDAQCQCDLISFNSLFQHHCGSDVFQCITILLQMSQDQCDVQSILLF